MTMTLIADSPVDVNAEGFMDRRRPVERADRRGDRRRERDPGSDRPPLAGDPLHARTYLKTGSAPAIRALGKESGVPIKELYQLFPKGPAKLAAKIGGIPKPHGCI